MFSVFSLQCVYMCIFGLSETIFPPVFGRRLQAQVSKKGEKLVMEVEVTGLPEPTVTWLKDDKPLQDAGISAHRLLAQGNSYRLIIEKGTSYGQILSFSIIRKINNPADCWRNVTADGENIFPSYADVYLTQFSIFPFVNKQNVKTANV